jgi:hypothetical protein
MLREDRGSHKKGRREKRSDQPYSSDKKNQSKLVNCFLNSVYFFGFKVIRLCLELKQVYCGF